MPEYQVSVSAFNHITVEASDPEEAAEKAKDKVNLPRGWEFHEVHLGAALRGGE